MHCNIRSTCFVLEQEEYRMGYTEVDLVTISLDEMHYRMAMDMIAWCVENDIDTPNAIKLAEAMATVGSKDNIVWELTMPASHLSWFILKWKE